MTRLDLPNLLSGSEVPLEALRARLGARCAECKSMITRTGTVDLFRLQENEGPPLMIKQSPKWSATHARGMWITLELLRLYTARTGLNPFAATPHNWGSDPAYVCAGWVEGKEMRTWFSETFADCEPGVAFLRAIEISGRYAPLLAHYHHAMSDTEMLIDVIPRKAKAIEQTGLSQRLIKLLRGGKAVERSERVRSIDDPGPHNTVEAPDGSLWMIDLPAHFILVIVERDIARFASRQAGAVRKYSNTSWIPRLAHYRRIVDAVVDGYESVGSPKSRPLDLPLVYACLGVDAALKAARTHRRLPQGARLEAFVYEFLTAILLSIVALWLRFCPSAPQQRSGPIDNSVPKSPAG